MPIHNALADAATEYFWGDLLEEDDAVTPEEDAQGKYGDNKSVSPSQTFMTARQAPPESSILTADRSALKTNNRRKGVLSAYDPASLS